MKLAPTVQYLSVLAVASVLAAGTFTLARATSPAQPGIAAQPAAVSADALARFKAAGKAAPLTVLPMDVIGNPFVQAGEVVAMMLERGGMTNLETTAAPFTPPKDADLATEARALAEFIKANPTPTEYALFTKLMGSREVGVTEVRAVVVNTRGEIVWQDRQAKGDAAFDRVKPREPMQACLLVAQALRPVLGLGDPESDGAPSGKIAARFNKQGGIPDKAELAAIEARTAAFRKAAPGASLSVYPSHAGAEFDADSAKSIVAQITQKKLTRSASVSDKGPRPEIAHDSNQQKMLWAMARAVSDHVRKNPPDTDYVLYADYLMGKDFVVGVHFAICNKQGELVVVDYQNSHAADFQAVKPANRADCDRLLIKRLESYCR